MSWVENKNHYQDIARSFWPGATLVTNRVLSAITGGRPFALGPWQIYKKDWGGIEFATIVHESGHNWTYEILGWLIPIIGWFFGRRVRAFCGIPLFLILYFLVPFFIGVAVFRCWFELIADRWRWRYMLSQGQVEEVRQRAKEFGREVSSTSSYLWALPGIGPGWYKRAAEKEIESAKAA